MTSRDYDAGRRVASVRFRAAVLVLLGVPIGCGGPLSPTRAPEEFGTHLARIRSGACSALVAHVGTQGDCLVIVECRLDSAHESYYDPGTGMLVATHAYDPLNGVDEWIPDFAGCAGELFIEFESVPCTE